MVHIQPTQFLKLLVLQQFRLNLSNSLIDVRTFNAMADELEDNNVKVKFGFDEFRECCKEFDDEITVGANYIEIRYSDQLKHTLYSYNRIYENLKCDKYINHLWEGLLKSNIAVEEEKKKTVVGLDNTTPSRTMPSRRSGMSTRAF